MAGLTESNQRQPGTGGKRGVGEHTPTAAPRRCCCSWANRGATGCWIDLLQGLTCGMPEKRRPGLSQDPPHDPSLPCTAARLLPLPRRCEAQKGGHCWAGAKGHPRSSPVAPRTSYPLLPELLQTRHRLTLQSSRYHGFVSAAASPVTWGSAVIDCKPMHHPEHATLANPPTA